jgi:hypothetical protein
MSHAPEEFVPRHDKTNFRLLTDNKTTERPGTSTKMNFFNPFSRTGAKWTFVGHTSSFPDVDDDAGNLAKHRLCNAKSMPGCRAFHIPKEDVSSAKEVPVGDDSTLESFMDQVLVFQYKGKFHAIDHVSKCLREIVCRG